MDAFHLQRNIIIEIILVTEYYIDIGNSLSIIPAFLNGIFQNYSNDYKLLINKSK